MQWKKHKTNLIVLYGCEMWAVTEHIKSSLKTCEQKILRKTYGPVKDQNGWRIWTNDELQVMYKKQNTVTTINVWRLERAGHLVRMSDDRNVKNVFLGKPDEKRRAATPKLRWLDCIENDLKLMGIKRWRKKAEDISMGYHSEGGTGETPRAISQWRTIMVITQVSYIAVILKKTEEIIKHQGSICMTVKLIFRKPEWEIQRRFKWVGIVPDDVVCGLMMMPVTQIIWCQW